MFFDASVFVYFLLTRFAQSSRSFHPYHSCKNSARTKNTPRFDQPYTLLLLLISHEAHCLNRFPSGTLSALIFDSHDDVRLTKRLSKRIFRRSCSHLFGCDYASLYARSCPSVGPSLRRSVPCYFRTTNLAVFEGKKLSYKKIINETMIDDEVVASYVPLWYLFCILHLL